MLNANAHSAAWEASARRHQLLTYGQVLYLVRQETNVSRPCLLWARLYSPNSVYNSSFEIVREDLFIITLFNHVHPESQNELLV